MMIAEVGDITKPKTEAIVNPANGVGVMGAGAAGAIAGYAGPSISNEAKALVKQKGCPFEAGEAYCTGSGRLKRRGVQKVYHAVTMKYPGGLTSIDIVGKAMRAVVQLALWDDVKSIAFPGLGTGIGRLDRTVVANTMVHICEEFDHKLKIKIIDHDEFFIKDIERYMGS